LTYDNEIQDKRYVQKLPLKVTVVVVLFLSASQTKHTWWHANIKRSTTSRL